MQPASVTVLLCLTKASLYSTALQWKQQNWISNENNYLVHLQPGLARFAKLCNQVLLFPSKNSEQDMKVVV